MDDRIKPATALELIWSTQQETGGVGLGQVSLSKHRWRVKRDWKVYEDVVTVYWNSTTTPRSEEMV